MPYTVEITVADRFVANGDVETRTYQLPDPYTAVADAKAAAEAHVAELGLEPATVVYNVFNREGFTVASNTEQPPGSG